MNRNTMYTYIIIFQIINRNKNIQYITEHIILINKYRNFSFSYYISTLLEHVICLRKQKIHIRHLIINEATG